MQRYFTAGRIVVLGNKAQRKRADYILKFTRDFPIAVVEAKPIYKQAADGLAQAKEYAQMLGLKFAYSSKGRGIVEFDFTQGAERELAAFPSPQELWERLTAADRIQNAPRLLQPYHPVPDSTPRYYQDIAIDRVVQHILQGKHRVLLTMATGAGKTVVAFQASPPLCARTTVTPTNISAILSGIEDGFLNPYRVHRVVSTYDATG